MHTGFVALLDVLGFTNLVNDDPGGRKVLRYLECLKSATAGTSVDFVVFSDSIVLTGTDHNPDGLLPIAEACSRLMFNLVQESIPVRGAIAYGEFQRETIDGGGQNSSNVFVAGRPIIEAYDFEQRQDWVGIMLAPSAVSAVRDLKTRCELTDDLDPSSSRCRWVSFLQFSRQIPFHDTQSFTGFAVVPCADEPAPTPVINSIRAVREKLDWLRLSHAPTPAAQEKYSRSVSWLGGVQSEWQKWCERRR
jgi:hypothetical protein